MKTLSSEGGDGSIKKESPRELSDDEAQNLNSSHGPSGNRWSFTSRALIGITRIHSLALLQRLFYGFMMRLLHRCGFRKLKLCAVFIATPEVMEVCWLNKQLSMCTSLQQIFALMLNISI
jgi:hypothetical protein